MPNRFPVCTENTRLYPEHPLQTLDQQIDVDRILLVVFILGTAPETISNVHNWQGSRVQVLFVYICARIGHHPHTRQTEDPAAVLRRLPLLHLTN